MGLNIDTLYEQVRAAMPVAESPVTAALTPVAPGIRVLALRTPTLPPASHTNAYLVGPPSGPQALVDPGSPYPDQQAALDAALEAETAAGRPLARVLLTHHHGDHAGGARAAAARWHVPIAAHAETAKRLGFVTEAIDEGDLGDGIEAIFTPGHAPGHLCYAHGGATIAGDMVASVGTILIDPSEGDMIAYLASLERLLARANGVLLPAHGAPIADGHAKLHEYIAHRLMREARVVAALAKARSAGVSIDALVAEAYGDTPRALWPLAARSLRAHLDKLVRDGRVRDDGDAWVLI